MRMNAAHLITRYRILELLIRWYQTVNGDPGITKESLDILKTKAAEMKDKGKHLLGCLMMDEMAIRQQVVWDEKTKKLEGVVHQHSNRHTAPIEQTAVAKEALVFMVTSVQDQDQTTWKIPVAYFLINGMSAEEKKHLIKTVLTSLHDAGVKIIAFTFDGTTTNIATANALGCSIRGSSVPIKTTFKHPASDHDVFVLMDPVHMLKLVRNTLNAQKSLIGPNGVVEWKYIENLNLYQNAIGQKLAPKLSDRHVHFENSKMKVVLAVQVLSNSVAVALDQLRGIHEDFAGCSATVEFISLFNDLFDLTNSMNETAKDFKRPLSKHNFDLYYEAFKYIDLYIRAIRLQNGSSILDSRCKTGFMGFLVALESFKGIFKTYVEENADLAQIFTYRFSQDHLENFFGAIRSKNGSNDNPNCVQFKASYKRLIVNNEIKNPSSSNCSNFEDVQSLTISNEAQVVKNDVQNISAHDEYEHLDSGSLTSTRGMDARYNDYILFTRDAGHNLAIRENITEVQRKLVAGLKCKSCSLIASRNITESLVTICTAIEYEFKVSLVLSHVLNPI